MKIAAITIALAGAVLLPAVAHADEVTCEGITVTAPAGTRAIIGLDAEPPYELREETGTFYFFSLTDGDHSYMVNVRDLVTDEQISYTAGSVGPCVAEPILAEPVIVEPAAVETPVVNVWAGVELAPPW